MNVLKNLLIWKNSLYLPLFFHIAYFVNELLGDYFSGDLFFLPAHCMLNFADWVGVGWILHMSPISVHNTSPCRLLYPPYTHMLNPPTHTYAHTPPSTQSRLLHGMCPPFKPLLYLLLSCPLFSSWWQNEFAYFSQGAFIRMHKPAAS